ncbi:DUF4160 domain-containing protein [Pelagerythrobacter marinus]|uniref:DUF4160 domain-containing protein n=1 Tax=Pelagerythrobacter marinus TaxID=538382 RepID=UPI0020375C80|nr:DUF4160 domain-containing protein [Pelagerythrobacter marinus]USA39758.1 DUF4160 domain-containing protein [Pelagerythrobacter marinus]WPZ06111.1 DUF4160 domain-containing protein [Pelagerythrobacter marinus]
MHVVGDGDAKINLIGSDGKPELVSNSGLKAGDLRKAMRIVAERRATMLQRREDIHG